MIDRRRLLVSGMTLAACAIATRPAWSATALSGTVTQGALLRGRVAAGTRVSVDGTLLGLSAQGDFAFGFAYDRTRPAVLKVETQDGATEEQTLTPSPREYDVQKINGLPDKLVDPPADVMDRINREAAQIEDARKRDTDEAWFADQFDWPVKGPLTGFYGSQRILNNHNNTSGRGFCRGILRSRKVPDIPIRFLYDLLFPRNIIARFCERPDHRVNRSQIGGVLVVNINGSRRGGRRRR